MIAVRRARLRGCRPMAVRVRMRGPSAFTGRGRSIGLLEADRRTVEGQDVDLPPEHVLDRAQPIALVARHERERLAGAAGATRPADAMHVVLRHVRQLVVDDLRQLDDVEPACSDVGGDEHLHLVAP